MIKNIFQSGSRREFSALVIFALALLATGFFAGWFIRPTWQTDQQAGYIEERRLGGYDFINPLLECDRVASVSEELRPFQHKIKMLIDEQKEKKWAMHVSVYFREMNNGLSFMIDGHEKFAPASLIKIPLLIAYLKWADAEPDVLKRKLTLKQMTTGEPEHIKPAFSLEPGRTYLIQDLLFRMTVYSDNNAFFLLYANVKPSILHRVYTDLGLEVPRIRGEDDYVTVSEYASFFRILFNASYLSPQASEQALEYMSEVDFRAGIVGGVPPDTVVSHMFGELTMGPSREIKQIHDCGIVYYPNHPYLLCIMSRGESFQYLDDTIREISKGVYEQVDNHYHGH